MKNIPKQILIATTIFLIILSCFPFSNSQSTQFRTIELVSKPVTDAKREYIAIEAIENLSSYKPLTSEMKSVVEYNLLSGEEFINNTFPSENILNITQIEPYEGLGYYVQRENIDSMLRASYVFPPDDRLRVSPTTSYPWRSVCKILVTAQNGSKYEGTGAIIDNFHVLTCGHLVHIKDAGGWVSDLTAIPGMDGSLEPYLSAKGVYFRSYTGWTQDEMSEHDWALITLDRSLGKFTGWMGVQTEDPSNSIYMGGVNTAGYPGDLNDGQYMYKTYDTGDGADEYNHYYWLDSAGGQSGSPVWLFDGSNRYILTIHAYSRLGVASNFGTRLNTEKN